MDFIFTVAKRKRERICRFVDWNYAPPFGGVIFYVDIFLERDKMYDT